MGGFLLLQVVHGEAMAGTWHVLMALALCALSLRGNRRVAKIASGVCEGLYGMGNFLMPTKKRPCSREQGRFKFPMVPKTRLELVQAFARHPLKMVCLPIPPLRQEEHCKYHRLVRKSTTKYASRSFSEPYILSGTMSEKIKNKNVKLLFQFLVCIHV
jgi:hypothetical protein